MASQNERDENCVDDDCQRERGGGEREREREREGEREGGGEGKREGWRER